MSWILSLFGVGTTGNEKITVQLIPEGSAAQALPGFHRGGLTLIATKGTTFERLLENFNAYRGPDSQISQLFTQGGEQIPLRTVITEPVVCKVRKI
jgi:hypothetical protein